MSRLSPIPRHGSAKKWATGEEDASTTSSVHHEVVAESRGFQQWGMWSMGKGDILTLKFEEPYGLEQAEHQVQLMGQAGTWETPVVYRVATTVVREEVRP